MFVEEPVAGVCTTAVEEAVLGVDEGWPAKREVWKAGWAIGLKNERAA